MYPLVRIPFAIFSSREEAIYGGWIDAEWGTWQKSPDSLETIDGWIALSLPDEMPRLRCSCPVCANYMYN